MNKWKFNIEIGANWIWLGLLAWAVYNILRFAGLCG